MQEHIADPYMACVIERNKEIGYLGHFKLVT